MMDQKWRVVGTLMTLCPTFECVVVSCVLVRALYVFGNGRH